jgi:uncharacterized protein with GYD domain
MKVFFLGAYSDKGREGMMASSYDARVKAVSAMVERAGAKLGSVDYLQGPFDVIADAEVDSYETASGLQAVMMAFADHGCRQSFECRKNSWRLSNAG